MRYVEWFSGIGGFRLGLEPLGFRCVAHSEIDPYACEVYRRRFGGLNLGDIHHVTPRQIPDAELWLGGFPCQPFSQAGRRAGEDDERHLWPVWFDLIAETRPRYLLLENVPGILSIDRGRAFGRILGDLASAGYDAEWSVISAADVGAPHLRKRLWVWAECTTGGGGAVADGDDKGKPRLPIDEISRSRVQEPQRSNPWPYGWSLDPADVVNAEIDGRGEGRGEGRAEYEVRGGGSAAAQSGCGCPFCGADQGPTPSLLGRVAHGIPHRVQRLKALGNAVVPQVVRWIGERIMARHNEGW